MFSGQYTLTAINGSIAFPFTLNTALTYTWYLVDEPKHKMHICIIPDTPSGSDIPYFLDYGKLQLDSKNHWTLPQTFTDYLAKRPLLLCGLNTYIEVYAEDDFVQDPESVFSLFDQLISP